MFPPHVALYHFVNLFQNDLAVDWNIPQINGVAFDQSHGNQENLVAVSFSSCVEFYFYTEDYETILH